jgi:hypothetical protein
MERRYKPMAYLAIDMLYDAGVPWQAVEAFAVDLENMEDPVRLAEVYIKSRKGRRVINGGK